MEKIEVEEYVRTENGKIYKETDCEITNNEVITYAGGEYMVSDTIVKHSKNLIDLIEVGDIVNGREVRQIGMFEGFPDYRKLIFVDETRLLPHETCDNDEIKIILTKEQYMGNCYKVGGQDE